MQVNGYDVKAKEHQRDKCDTNDADPVEESDTRSRHSKIGAHDFIDLSVLLLG